MQQVTINSRRLLMTPAVEDADEYYISGLRYLCARKHGRFLAFATLEILPEGSKILGALSTITESEAAELVEKAYGPDNGIEPCPPDHFADYTFDGNSFITATASLRSLAASLGMAGEVVILECV